MTELLFYKCNLTCITIILLTGYDFYFKPDISSFKNPHFVKRFLQLRMAI